jgi:DNA mismatch repair protein MutS2
LAECRTLAKELRSSVGPRGDILDSASFELGELRRDVLRLRSRIRRTLETLLTAEHLAGAFQDRIVTERGGRYVVPVRADHRGQVKGFIHDESASGQTLFVEPTLVLEANNELQARLREEKREEERILRRLAAMVRAASPELAANQALLARLDGCAAAARYARQAGACAPQLAAEPLIELRGARHPLLLFQPDGSPRTAGAVPVDLLLGSGSDVLVISGPNTGGKTVALKTVGLLQMMVAAGLPVPCQADSRVHLFGRVFADIGDEQSIENNLSTFSGHLARICTILAEADGDSLVLLDEAGTGTDPAEGGALALAVLDELRARGARLVLTTHLNLIKGYALLQTGVENAAVEFDPHTLAPTYRLHYGIPGASSAFTIARLLGLPEPVLARAETYLGGGEREGLDLIERLNLLQRELEGEREEARRLREEAGRDREQRKRLLLETEAQKQTILDRAGRLGEDLVRRTEVRLRELFANAEKGAAAPPERARLIGQVREVRAELSERSSPAPRRYRTPRDLRPGELVRVPALETEAEVVRVSGAEVELTARGKKLRLPLPALEQFQPRRFAAGRPPALVRSSVERDAFQPRLLLVGKRVEVALPLLERLLDDALLHDQPQVEVVHGAGEGILRRAVRECLARHPAVTAFHAAAPEQGGDKVTIVELRGG